MRTFLFVLIFLFGCAPLIRTYERGDCFIYKGEKFVQAVGKSDVGVHLNGRVQTTCYGEHYIHVAGINTNFDSAWCMFPVNLNNLIECGFDVDSLKALRNKMDDACIISLVKGRHNLDELNNIIGR